jgi:hypothetical protein
VGLLLFGYATTQCVGLWTETETDADPASGRNLFVAGNCCVAVHDDPSQAKSVKALLSGLVASPLEMAKLVGANLRTKAASTKPPPRFGVVFGGFDDGRPMFVGIRSGRDSQLRQFYPSVNSGTLPASIFNYLTTSLAPVLERSQDVIDILTLNGHLYAEQISPVPTGMALCVAERDGNARLLDASEIAEARERCFQRLDRFQANIVNLLVEGR